MKSFSIIFGFFFHFVSSYRTVIIGDSMFKSGFWSLSENSRLVNRLIQLSGHDIENHAKIGASLHAGWVESIQEQFQNIEEKYTVDTLIMDGGGNDVLSHRRDCEAFNDDCVVYINKSIVIAEEIFQEANREGIINLIYLGFYYLPGLEKAVDFADDLLHRYCTDSKIHCFFVDPRYNETSGTGLKTPDLLGNDRIHPNQEGYELLANMIWNISVLHNITI